MPGPARSRSREVLAAAVASAVALALVWSVVHWWPSPTVGGVPRAQESVRLGPLPGQSVSGYLDGLADHLPPAGAGPVPALIQFTAERDTADVAALVAAASVTPMRVVFRVPLPRVQTALRFEQLTDVDLRDPPRAGQRRLTLARDTAAREAAADASRATGRQATVARFEAAELGGDCRCVLAVLALGDRAALTALSSHPGVRAVDAAPVGANPAEMALTPLLPEQSGTVGPPPDDGPVPAVPVNPGGSG